MELHSIQGGVLYNAHVSIGGQSLEFIVDTGSTTTAVASSRCPSCNVPKYTPGATATDLLMTTSAAYGNGTIGWTGEIYRDMVAIDGVQQGVPLEFAAMTSQRKFFVGAGDQASGLIGVGPSVDLIHGTTSYLAQMVAAGLPPTLAFHLCQADGQMWLGGWDPQAATGPVQFTPAGTLGTGDLPFYAVRPSEIRVGSTSLAASYPQFMIDTGTGELVLPSTLFAAFAQAVQSSPGFQATFPGATPASLACFPANSLTSAQIDAALPGVSIALPAIGGGSFALSATATQSYMVFQHAGEAIDISVAPAATVDSWCFAVLDGGTSIPPIIGDALMRAFLTVLDLGNYRIGFAPQVGCAPTIP